MGIDACGYFVTRRPLTDEEIERVLADFNTTYYDEWAVKFRSLRTDSDFTPNCVRIDFDLDRLYSEGYARGNFVKHATICGWLRRRKYVEAVYYGGDCSDLAELSEWTQDTERKLFDLYLTSNRLSYRDSKHEFFDPKVEAKQDGTEK